MHFSKFSLFKFPSTTAGPHYKLQSRMIIQYFIKSVVTEQSTNVGEKDIIYSYKKWRIFYTKVNYDYKFYSILSHILLFHQLHCVIFILDEPHECVLINDKVLILLSLYLLLFHTK